MRRASFQSGVVLRSVLPAVFALLLAVATLGGMVSAPPGQGGPDDRIAPGDWLKTAAVREDAEQAGQPASAPPSAVPEIDPAALDPALPVTPVASAVAVCGSLPAATLPARDPRHRCTPIRAPPRA